MVLVFTCLAAISFEVASVKRSSEQKGLDGRGQLVVSIDRLSARNVTLRALIAAAYHVQQSQVSGNLKWLDSEEFDIDARTQSPATPGQMGEMLQSLLAERFHLTLSREEKELAVLALVIAKGGPRLQGAKGSRHFHGDMRQLADLLSVQATIPASADPSRPSLASSSPVMVVDKTGLEGVNDFDFEINPDGTTDQLTQWRRVLKEQLGLDLHGQRLKVQILLVAAAERVPVSN